MGAYKEVLMKGLEELDAARRVRNVDESTAAYYDGLLDMFTLLTNQEVGIDEDGYHVIKGPVKPGKIHKIVIKDGS